MLKPHEINTAPSDVCCEAASHYISVDELAKKLAIARATAYQLAKISGFPCFYVGKRIIIPLHAFNQWANEQANRQATLLEK